MDVVDIVMAAFNGEIYLKEQIESITESTYKNWRLFVCDDGSTDRTEQIVREYEQKYPKQIFWKPNSVNKGVSKNFLDGARTCAGDYIMFCDQDDVWLPGKIEWTLRRMHAVEKKYGRSIPITVFTDASVVDERLQIKEESFHRSNRLDTKRLDLPHMLMENKMMGCTMMFNRALKDKLEKIPEHARMHDWWVGLIAAGFGKIVYLNQPTILYRQHGNNSVGSQKFSMKKVLEQAAGIRKIREAVKSTQRQAEEFYEIYNMKLKESNRMTVYDFSQLGNQNFWIRRKMLLKYGFWKSGFIRNIGLILII